MESTEVKQMEKDQMTSKNECPVKDKDGNCLVQGVYSDSKPIGGG